MAVSFLGVAEAGLLAFSADTSIDAQYAERYAA